ncbi:MAG: site-specific DNA-methyltransferase [Synergistaceae bacterium]|nr:site-specific DNA-methyltransferase [Synergistaceae bacterium]
MKRKLPTLEWIGKDKVINHHQDVPYRILEHKYTYVGGGVTGDETADGNKIIKGDNLAALKSLLPQYEGKIKCIYIDPPYNTGNEGWVYNDNVNDPKIKKWLNQVVGREGEDLSRHDKWLCMMYPRLKLLQRLLSDDGAIFISIDDTEQANLRLICDEIFGARNFIANILWQKRYSQSNDHKTICPMHDFLLVYRKSEIWQRNLLPRTIENDRQYRYEDEMGVFRPDNYTCNKSADERPNLYYPIINPNTGEEIWPKKTRVWSFSQEMHEENIKKDLVFWGKDGTAHVPSFKRYRDALRGGGGTVPTTWWTFEFAGHNDSARKEIRQFSLNIDFNTPKPSSLVERILQIAASKDCLILDSFAGSGTTAHAVLNMNWRDGGDRKFILVEMEDYAETITAERIRRVIDGYSDVEGTGGSFSFYELGEPMLLEDGNLNENVPVELIREYVFYMETKLPLPKTPRTTSGQSGNHYYLGGCANTDYYFYYERDSITTLDRAFLRTLNNLTEGYVIYADKCRVSPEELKKACVVFKKIPRDIARL